MDKASGILNSDKVDLTSTEGILHFLFDDYDPILQKEDFWLSSSDTSTNDNWELCPEEFLEAEKNLDLLDVFNSEFDENQPIIDPSFDPLEGFLSRQPSSSNSSCDSLLSTDEAIPIKSPKQTSIDSNSPTSSECNIYIDVYQNDAELALEEGEVNEVVIDDPETKNDDSIITILPVFYEEVVSTNEQIKDATIINKGIGKCREVKLTSEEKRLLEKEGLSLPSIYPLTRDEEKDLKRVQRKIRNKISAQDSRKRKKEYIDGLESRVKVCTDQNDELKKKVTRLEGQNKSLISELKKLQLLVKNCGNKNVQSSTCMFILLLSFVLIVSPNVWSFSKDNAPGSSLFSFNSGNARVLLSNDNTKLLGESDQSPSKTNMGSSLASEDELNTSQEHYRVGQVTQRSLLSHEREIMHQNFSSSNKMESAIIKIPHVA